MWKLGIEVLDPRDAKIWGRCALLCNQASIDSSWTHSIEVLQEKLGDSLSLLFCPQHGLSGDVQDNMIETPHSYHQSTGLPIFSLYSETREPSSEVLKDIDTIVVDLQIVGCRVYTFKATIRACLKVAKDQGKKVVVLDRPNPLGGVKVEGPVLQPSMRSFVGPMEMPLRHGLTVGEVARLCNSEIGAELEICPLRGWDPQKGWHQANRPWTLTSPNLPTIDSVFAYYGTVLFEGTNLSEGRGTGLPFQLIGAPYIANSETLVQHLKSTRAPLLEGVVLRPAEFIPTSSKWAGELCRGFQIYITEPENIRILELSVAVISVVKDMFPQHFEFRSPPYEYEFEKKPIDLILGVHNIEKYIDRYSENDSVWSHGIEAYKQRASQVILYDRSF